MSTDTSQESFVFKGRVKADEVGLLADYLVSQTGLARRKIKEAISRGAVWTQRGKGEKRRLRRSNFMLRLNDQVELFFDEATLFKTAPHALCVADMNQYSVWFKPFGLAVLGNNYGDNFSIERQVSTFFDPPRECLVSNNLDEDTAGLMIFSHSNSTASKFSVLFARHRVQKKYRVQVEGQFEQTAETGSIVLDVGGKPATTEYQLLSYDGDADVSTLEVSLAAERPGQLARHFESINHPILVDTQFKQGEEVASHRTHIIGTEMRFDCPLSNREVVFSLDEKHIKF